MMKHTLGEVCKATGGRLLQGTPEQVVDRVGTDTRTLEGGALFFALKGTQFDGHDYLGQAVTKGAAALIVDRDVRGVAVPVVRVDDTTRALQALARHNRLRAGIPVVAVTGSTGKTTTKDLLMGVLVRRYRVLATKGNLNNEYGLPLTLLEIGEEHEVAVVEMGMRGLGQIDALCKVALPTIGVITNISETHLELLGSVSNIAEAKGELVQNLPGDGLAVIHGDSPFADRLATRCSGRVVRFGAGEYNDIHLLSCVTGQQGTRFKTLIHGAEQDFFIPVPGRHIAVNALAAIAVGLELGLELEEIRQGMTSTALSPLRLHIMEIGGLTIINDTYNASPASVKAALNVLSDLADSYPRIAVLGSMFELGTHSEKGHLEVGRAAAESGITTLVTVGEEARLTAKGALEAGMDTRQVISCATNDETVRVLETVLPTAGFVLVKGSRGVRMEQIVEALIQLRQPVEGSSQ
ncbi:MAG: UDP-N-acetylmuramoyl-tripeptide--D-alanyl-D-alanine ligase [Desulforudis sp.]|jgi:UDP-N-acetylmuramoyl-tripeptide--D-alanyl-D-alanine ligase|nr:MAG: UDP-N-acetylmuramoyl-tripeptide--D-alanyl-D-alanine ligase [Desulforudis sp.]